MKIREFICPITHELPIKPVTAEDGKIYEEKAIREWWAQKDGEPTSPSTGAVIGTSYSRRRKRETRSRRWSRAAPSMASWPRHGSRSWRTRRQVKEMRAKAKAATDKLVLPRRVVPIRRRTASRKTRRKPARGTSAARRPATQRDGMLLVNVSCVASVVPRTSHSGSLW